MTDANGNKFITWKTFMVTVGSLASFTLMAVFYLLSSQSALKAKVEIYKDDLYKDIAIMKVDIKATQVDVKWIRESLAGANITSE